MSYYELMILFSPNLNEQEEKDQYRQVEDLLKSQQANIHLTDHWGRRKLAYPIKKQRQGIYDWFYFEMEPSRVSEVDRKLKMSEQVLRFMLLKMEKVQIGNLHREMKRRAEAAVAEPAAAESATPAVTPDEAPESVITAAETPATAASEPHAPLASETEPAANEMPAETGEEI